MSAAMRPVFSRISGDWNATGCSAELIMKISAPSPMEVVGITLSASVEPSRNSRR